MNPAQPQPRRPIYRSYGSPGGSGIPPGPQFFHGSNEPPPPQAPAQRFTPPVFGAGGGQGGFNPRMGIRAPTQDRVGNVVYRGGGPRPRMTMRYPGMAQAPVAGFRPLPTGRPTGNGYGAPGGFVPPPMPAPGAGGAPGNGYRPDGLWNFFFGHQTDTGDHSVPGVVGNDLGTGNVTGSVQRVRNQNRYSS